MERANVRQSNFELLRLVAIFMIIVHHLVIKSAETCGYTHAYSYIQDGIIGLLINGLVVGGVNVFLLISGWFGVKKTYSQIIRLILDCFIYCLLTNLFCIYALGYPFSLSELLYSCNFLHNWFVSAFVVFLLLVPIIEKALDSSDFKTLGAFVILATLANVVLGYCMGQYNTNGYNPFNFVYIYILGRFIKELSLRSRYSKYFSYCYLVWLICSVVLALGFILLTRQAIWTPSLSQRYFGYNNPLIVASSISVFVMFAKLKIQNVMINRLAKGVFGIFLLHTTSIFIYYRSSIVGQFYKDYGYIAILLSACAIFITCSLVALLVERIKEPLYQTIYRIFRVK